MSKNHDDWLRRWLPPDPEWGQPRTHGLLRAAAWTTCIAGAAGLAMVVFGGERVALHHVPDPTLTPGEVRSTDPAVVCARPLPPRPDSGAWRLLKREAMRQYGLAGKPTRDYELDHLVPRELGGADTLSNLWPEPWPEAREKDKIENSEARDFCTNDRSPDGLLAVQRWFATAGWSKSK